MRIQAIGIGECRIVCSCSYDVPLNSTGGLANIIYLVKVTDKKILVSDISLNKSVANIFVGGYETLYADIFPSNASFP